MFNFASEKPRSKIAIIIVVPIVLFIVLPLIAPYDPRLAVSGAELTLPATAHLLGTDGLGRDVLSRLLHGAGQTIGIAALGTLIAALPGVLLGVWIGFVGGWVDGLIGLLLEALLAFPGLLLAFVVIALLGSGPLQIALAVGMSGVAPMVRVARGAAWSVRVQPYIEAAESIGVRRSAILMRHILPNTLSTVGSFIAVTFGWALLNGAALTFLGFGGDPSAPEWGVMLTEGRQILHVQPFLALSSGAALTVTVLMVNALAGWLTASPSTRYP